MMPLLQVLGTTMLLILPALLGSTAIATDQHVFTSTAGTATLRTATWDDLDQIIAVGFDAFSPGPAWQYTNPDYKQYEDYIKYCAKKGIKEIFRDGVPDNVFIKVITVPRTEASAHDGHGNEEVVAFAGWHLRMEGDDSKVRSLWDFVLPPAVLDSITRYKDTDKLEYDCSLQLGTNITRLHYHNRILGDAEEKYIDSQFTRNLYLAVLATHPTWDGHNFGATNLQWGMELAKMKDVPITLIATPAGHPLYRSVGFQDIHNITMEMLDGEGLLWYEAMKYELV